MTAKVLYIIGLCVVILYIIIGFDDFIWDIATMLRRIFSKSPKLDMKELDSKPPRLIALIIAAWNEDNVLKDVVENIVMSQEYPRSMYHVLLGVYPNDEKTIRVARELESKYENVHCIINNKPGPTSKAQNINHVISCLKDLEIKHNRRFAAICIHDSEDLVHPYEFKVTNYLLDKYKAMQFPVFPLIKKPTFANFFKNITTNTYADEFAENHFITMVSRNNSGAFVPSAGTGFALSRDTVDFLGESVLPENYLTEDYRLSLNLYEKKIPMHYILEKVRHVNYEGKMKWDYIATRSMFPNTFKTAVKQKTRWTLGITMQSYKFRNIFKDKLSFAGKYSLYHDQKAKIGNLLSIIGYPILIYFLVSLFIPLTPIYPYFSLSWWLSLVVTVFMLERQTFRAVSLYNVYGWKSVFFGCLLPPILPIRIIWGNIINLVSTVRAYLQFHKRSTKPDNECKNINAQIKQENSEYIKQQIVINNESKVIQQNTALDGSAAENTEPKKFAWDKTEHSFLPMEVLARYHKKLGDALIKNNYLEPEQVFNLLKEKAPEKLFGEYLLEKNCITQEQLMKSIAEIKHVQFVEKQSLCLYDLAQFKDIIDKRLICEYKSLPLLKLKDGYVFAYCYESPNNAQTVLRDALQTNVYTAVATYETVMTGIDMIWQNKPLKTDGLADIKNENVSYEQQIIINNYSCLLNLPQSDIIKQIGLNSGI